METKFVSINTLICKSIWFCQRPTWNPTESRIRDVSRQLNVLHQAASCFTLQIHKYKPKLYLIALTKRCFSQMHSFAYQVRFDGWLTWNPAESPVCDVSRQLNVLHQAASYFGWYDIRVIAIHVQAPMDYPTGSADEEMEQLMDLIHREMYGNESSFDQELADPMRSSEETKLSEVRASSVVRAKTYCKGGLHFEPNFSISTAPD
ncbi:hypothetical protein CSKR_110840 [Clonorchis sinensis]|uniref:Uncharacterized protein n=1 Tax=Clonorchis sinensis TaxID=79923 RepID=A0A419Q3V9_CLOSI|nr:hypothetical protein CSKR_110840 [Clonorchis sinensis]